MEALKICLTAVLSIIELFILTKIMGKRQVSQLSLFDYINGITIGSIAADMAFCEINEFWKPALAMAIYGIFSLLFSILCNKSIVFRRFFAGKSILLMNNDEIYRNNLKKCKLDINEFLAQCRISGYFNPDDLQTVIMEPTGKLSFLPKSNMRPANPDDLGINPKKETSPIVVVSDGKILHGNLQANGKNEIWLRSELKKGNHPPIEKILLAMADSDNTLYVYPICNDNKGKDLFT